MANDYDNIIIFLGPSLLAQEALTFSTNSHILPPAQSGDILRALRLKPTLIVLIDGYFENTASVWHKELLYAIEQGVTVIAGGSMGALRASELATFGVIPMGKIAQWYLDNTLQDDDEVAVLHGTKQSHYAPLTDAMVNIRATLYLAYEERIISKFVCQQIEMIAKQLFYTKRTFRRVLQIAEKHCVNHQEVKQFEQWLKVDGHYQDIKRQDALYILRKITEKISLPKSSITIVYRTAFFRALQKNVMCRPFSSYQYWLPIQEKTVLASRYLGATYRLVRRLAYLLVACYNLAKQINLSEYDENIARDEFELQSIFNNIEWERINDCSDLEKKEFIQRLTVITRLFKYEQSLTDIPGTYEDYLLLLMCLSGDYTRYKILHKTNVRAVILQRFKENDQRKYRLLFYFAYCWWTIERSALRLGLQPDNDALQNGSDNFRRYHQLHTAEITKKWIENNDLDLNDYQYLIAANYRLNFLVFENNMDTIISSNEDTNHWWLLDALWLSEYYSEAKNILDNPLKLMELKIKAKEQITNLDEYAHSLDFIGGEEEFSNEQFTDCLFPSEATISTMGS